MLRGPVKCRVTRKRVENVQAVSKEFTKENVLFRLKISVGGKVLGGECEWE